MSDLNFGSILKELGTINRKYPDLRFGEIIQSSVDILKSGTNVNIHNVSSKSLLKAIKDFHRLTDKRREKYVKK